MGRGERRRAARRTQNCPPQVAAPLRSTAVALASWHTSAALMDPKRLREYLVTRRVVSLARRCSMQFRHLNQRVTMLQEELLELRRQQQQERLSRGGGWWGWMGSSGKAPAS